MSNPLKKQVKKRKIWKLSHIVKEPCGLYGTYLHTEEWAYLYTDDGEVKKVKILLSPNKR